MKMSRINIRRKFAAEIFDTFSVTVDVLSILRVGFDLARLDLDFATFQREIRTSIF